MSRIGGVRTYIPRPFPDSPTHKYLPTYLDTSPSSPPLSAIYLSIHPSIHASLSQLPAVLLLAPPTFSSSSLFFLVLHSFSLPPLSSPSPSPSEICLILLYSTLFNQSTNRSTAVRARRCIGNWKAGCYSLRDRDRAQLYSS